MKTQYNALNMKKGIICVFLVILSFIASLTFYVSPSMNMDFVRIQEEIPSYQTSQTLNAYLNSESITSNNETIKYTYTFNVIVYLFGKYVKNHYVLVWFSAILDYSIVCWMIYDWTKNKKQGIHEWISCFIVSMAFLPFVHVVSGIRAAMAACLMALGIYLLLYRKRSIFIYLLLSLLSVTIHPYTLYAIPITLLVHISPTLKSFIIVLVGTLSIEYLAPIIGKKDIPFLSMMARRFVSYTSASQYTSYRTFYYGVILCSLLLAVYYIFFIWRNKKISHSQKKMCTFLACYAGLIIGSFGSYDIVCRLAYLLGAMAPVVTEAMMIGNNNDKYKYVIRRCIFIVFILLSIFTFYKHIQYYGGHFKLSHILLSIGIK